MTALILPFHICKSVMLVVRAHLACSKCLTLALPQSPETGHCVRGGWSLSSTTGFHFLLEGCLCPQIPKWQGQWPYAFSRAGQAGTPPRTLPHLLIYVSGTSQEAALQGSFHGPNVG